jgi:hypothetical protein
MAKSISLSYFKPFNREGDWYLATLDLLIIVMRLFALLHVKHLMSFTKIIIMQTRIAIGIALPRDMIKKIDLERGDVSRSRYLLRLLERVCTSNNNRKIIRSENSAGSLDNGSINQLA